MSSDFSSPSTLHSYALWEVHHHFSPRQAFLHVFCDGFPFYCHKVPVMLDKSSFVQGKQLRCRESLSCHSTSAMLTPRFLLPSCSSPSATHVFIIRSRFVPFSSLSSSVVLYLSPPCLPLPCLCIATVISLMLGRFLGLNVAFLNVASIVSSVFVASFFCLWVHVFQRVALLKVYDCYVFAISVSCPCPVRAGCTYSAGAFPLSPSRVVTLHLSVCVLLFQPLDPCDPERTRGVAPSPAVSFQLIQLLASFSFFSVHAGDGIQFLTCEFSEKKFFLLFDNCCQ